MVHHSYIVVCRPVADSNTLRLRYVMLNDSRIKVSFPNVLFLRGMILLMYFGWGRCGTAAVARRAHPLSIVDRTRFENYQRLDIEAANDTSRISYLVKV